jgi:sodium pump decarboxylase gamma subunit
MSNLFSGLFLMLVGMGTVYLFLTLLILVAEGIRIVWGEKPAPPAPPAAPRLSGEDEALRAAVVAATLIHHRRPRS